MSDTQMHTWTCRHADCLGKADGVGNPGGLLSIGWYVRNKEDGDYELYCPEHHPDGMPIAEKQALDCQTSMYQGLKILDGGT